MRDTAATVAEETGIALTFLLGLDADTLTIHNMVARAVVVFLFALLIVRIGNKRFIGGNTAFDMILSVMLGSVISRAITGQSPFIPTLCAALALVALHAAFGKVAFRFDLFGNMIKGKTRILIRDGRVDWDAMGRSNLSRDDLLEELRLQASVTDWTDVREARLERNGKISVILKRHPEA